MAPKLAKNEFKEWLILNKDIIIGKSKDQCSCPLALFLQTKYKTKSILVSQKLILCKKHRINSQKWMKDFIKNIDQFDGFIYGKTALKILEKI